MRLHHDHPGLRPEAAGDDVGQTPGAHVPAPGGTPAPMGGCTPGGRLNLLLSCAGWRDDSWADRLPRLLEPMGIASHRAASARDAERTIRSMRVHIAVVDLGLPLESQARSDAAAAQAEQEPAGARLLQLLARLDQPPPTVVIKGYAPSRQENRLMNAALRHDAFAIVDRAAADIELMLRILQRALTRFYAGRWPGPGPHAPSGGTPPTTIV